MESTHEKHVKVALRMIGHQVLLAAGDSTSQVLPIIEEDGRYRIQFANKFLFDAGHLVEITNKVIDEAQLGTHYIVEVEDCNSSNIVYSFEIDALNEQDITPCLSRDQKKSCYSILITLLNENEQATLSNHSELISKKGKSDRTSEYLIFIVILIVPSVFVGLYQRKIKHDRTNDHISRTIGDFEYDSFNNQLLLDGKSILLTSKEADLLLLLHDHHNNTLERDIILNKVWGDEGDYIGRTLDVFISKLRKKLDASSSVKILNVRGVGYKLVVSS